MKTPGRLVGYLFTDVEGSTERWERAPSRMKSVMARHDVIIDRLLDLHFGVIEDRAGDGVFARFDTGNPLACAIDIQLALEGEDWSEIDGLSVRFGIHAGTLVDGDDRDQVAINRAARIMSCAWGGQIVISDAAAVAYALPPESKLNDLGICHFKGVDEPLKLFGLIHPGFLRTKFPPLRSLSIHSPTLPVSMAPFFGRQHEQSEITTNIQNARSRLISIVGPGGIGKSRLATEVASEFVDRRAVCYVALDTLANATELASAIASALRLPFYGSEPQERQLTDYLRDRNTLLVLDNVDGIVGDAGLISRLLDGCRSVAILATGREPLGIPGEFRYRLVGFPAPGPYDHDLRTSPAYQMFAHEALASDRRFAPPDEDLTTLRKIFDLLDGSPLALHLTAQWTHLLSLEAILARLQNGLGFLSEQRHRAAGRHSSLGAVFEGSWALLTPSQQGALASLSVFAGEFDARAAEHVSGLDLNTVAALERKALIEQVGRHRLTMHAVVQAHAGQKLAENSTQENEARERHASYYLDLIRMASSTPPPAAQGVVLDQLQQEMANLRDAWTYSLQNSFSHAVRLAVDPVFYFLVLRSLYREGPSFFDVETDDDSLNTHLKAVLANCLVHQGELERAEATASVALDGREGSLVARAHAIQALGNIAHIRGELDTAREHYERALATRAGLSDLMGCFFSTFSLSALHLLTGNMAAARDYVRQCLQYSRDGGNTNGLMVAYFLAGDIALRENRPADAHTNFAHSLRIEEMVNNPQYRASILLRLGSALASVGDITGAAARHREAFDLATDVGDQRHRALALLNIGRDHVLERDHNLGRDSILQAMRLGRQLGAKPLIQRGLFELAGIEMGLGNKERARRLASGIDSCDFGSLQNEYDGLLAQLGHVSGTGGHRDESEAELDEMFSEQNPTSQFALERNRADG